MNLATEQHKQHLTNISSIDGRYHSSTNPIRELFCEYTLIKHRVEVEIQWFMTLANTPDILEIPNLSDSAKRFLIEIVNNFSLDDALQVKNIERDINHDVKAVEYFLKDRFANFPELANLTHFIHFALTSEDINNIAYNLMSKNCLNDVIIPRLNSIINTLESKSSEFMNAIMPARTHGQIASPTTMGKEIYVFVQRLKQAMLDLQVVPFTAKCNGAVGNFNAHYIAYPNVNWPQLCSDFIEKQGLKANIFTTQIEPHDNFAKLFMHLQLLNNILLDFTRDCWEYISLGYFRMKVASDNVGSSTMPHKVNPRLFENAEGNLELANNLFGFLANKLTKSRMQRDLSDSTCLRNIGLAFSYTLIAYDNLTSAIAELNISQDTLTADLQDKWYLLAEAIQTVMRKHGVTDSYEQLKSLTQNKNPNKTELDIFINSLPIPDESKQKLLSLQIHDYTGIATQFLNLKTS